MSDDEADRAPETETPTNDETPEPNAGAGDAPSDAPEAAAASEAEGGGDGGGGDAEAQAEVDVTPPKAPPKFLYECQRCGHYCAGVEGAPLTVQDLLRWQESGTLNTVVPHIGVDISLGFPRLTLKPKGEAKQGCPFYDADNRNCQLYHDLPLGCRAYPLAYTGKKYVVVDQKCQGLDKGAMTADKLHAHRDAALEEYQAKVATGSVLPLLYGIIMGEMMEQSRKAMESMTPEQKAELEKMFKDKAE